MIHCQRRFISRSRLVAISVACLALAVASKTSAQVSAYQGVPKKDPVQEFESPMVLELPLPGLGELVRGQAKGIGLPLRNFVCEDTSIFTLRVERGRDKKRQGRLETSLEFEGLLRVRPSYDRLVDLELSFIKEDTVIAKKTLYRIDAEEGRYPKFKTSFEFAVEEFDAVFRKEPAPTLKIIVTVTDND